MIEFFTSPTPNCQKVAIFLEEVALEYQAREISLLDGEQKLPAFTAINPNARVPAIRDTELGCTVSESGAILIHLAEKTGRFLPAKPVERAQVIQWLMFQMSAVGPMQGQANVFYRYTPEKFPYVIERYQRECRRLYGVMDQQLAQHDYLAGKYSIADMATYPWVRMGAWAGLSLEGLSSLQAWVERISERPAVQRTREHYEPDLLKDAENIGRQAQKVLS